jgi:biotin carboxyl carrier protein
MSLYQVTIENRVYQVNISDDQCTVDGKIVEGKVLRLNRNGLHMMRYGKQALEIFLSTLDDNTYQMLMSGGLRIITRISSRLGKNAKAGVHEADENRICAPMHGLVVDIKVREGEIVDADKTLVVLESMKMQMQLRAKRSGRISKINVQPGDQVEKGEALIQFDQPESKE